MSSEPVLQVASGPGGPVTCRSNLDNPGTDHLCPLAYSQYQIVWQSESPVKILAIAQSKGGPARRQSHSISGGGGQRRGWRPSSSTPITAAGARSWSGSLLQSGRLCRLQHNADPMLIAHRIPEFNCLVLPGSHALSELPADLPITRSRIVFMPSPAKPEIPVIRLSKPTWRSSTARAGT
jgi:hypothetical protein